MNTSIQEVFRNQMGDAKLRSVSWDKDDLILDLIPPDTGSASDFLRLHFYVVSRLRIDLDYDVYAGEPLVFSANANEVENNTWKVTIEFGAAPEGEISFECVEIRTTSPITQ